MIGATCYWLVVELLPILFIYCVHHRNFSIQLRPEAISSAPIHYSGEVSEAFFNDIDDEDE